MTLAELCKETRGGMGLSQKAFAKLIGTNQTEVSFIERGFIPNDKAKVEAIENLQKQNRNIA